MTANRGDKAMGMMAIQQKMEEKITECLRHSKGKDLSEAMAREVYSDPMWEALPVYVKAHLAKKALLATLS